jgi:parvulin-like peptidyl-prolyl isomerase
MMKRKLLGTLLAGAMTCSLLLSGCGKLNADAVLVTINGGEETISLGYGNFVARYTQSLYDSAYGSYYGTSLWTMKEDDGTFEDSVKENLLESMEEEYLLNLHAQEYDVALTEDEEAAIAEAVQEFLSDNPEETLEAMSATEEIVTKYLTQVTIAQRVEDAIKESADVNITEEEAAQRTFTYAYFNSVSYTDSDGNTLYYTDDEKETLLAEAEALTDSEDLETDAGLLGATVNTHSYGGDDEDTMDQAVLDAADALDEGEISSVVTVDGDGYYVVRLDSAFDEEATAEKMETMETEQRSDYLTSVLDGWKEDTDWQVDEKQWAKVRFTSFFNFVTADDTDEDAE